jgi:hypothetical protein
VLVKHTVLLTRPLVCSCRGTYHASPPSRLQRVRELAPLYQTSSCRGAGVMADTQ